MRTGVGETGKGEGVVCARPLPPAVVVVVGLALMMIMDVGVPAFSSLVVVLGASLPDPGLDLELDPAVTGIIVNPVIAPLFESAVFTLMIIVLAISVVLGTSAVVLWVVGAMTDP